MLSLRCSQALIAHDDEVHAIDATCYHMGGPLLHADIEEYGSFGACVVCPWHRYPISLRTGECLYRNMSGTACSKGLKQRVHEVVRRNGRILVRLASAPDKVESDTYAFKAPPPSGGMPPHKLRSGEVLRAGAAGSRERRIASGGTAHDVMKSMSGADGRAPWARSSVATVAAQPGVRKAATVGRAAVLGEAADGASSLKATRLHTMAREVDWSRHVIHSRVEVGRRCVRLTLRGNLPATSADWTCGAHAMVRLEGDEGGEQPYTPYQRVGASAAGTFELVVKAYPQGALSPRIAALQPGDALLLRGPVGGAGRNHRTHTHTRL